MYRWSKMSHQGYNFYYLVLPIIPKIFSIYSCIICSLVFARSISSVVLHSSQAQLFFLMGHVCLVLATMTLLIEDFLRGFSSIVCELSLFKQLVRFFILFSFNGYPSICFLALSLMLHSVLVQLFFFVKSMCLVVGEIPLSIEDLSQLFCCTFLKVFCLNTRSHFIHFLGMIISKKSYSKQAIVPDMKTPNAIIHCLIVRGFPL